MVAITKEKTTVNIFNDLELFKICLIRAFDVGETQQKLYNNIYFENISFMAKSNAEKIIVAEKELKKYCNINTDDAVKIMEKIIKDIEARNVKRAERLVINHDTEILDALRSKRVRQDYKELQKKRN